MRIPPSKRPTPPPAAAIAENTANARLRSLPSANVVVSSPRAEGASIAPNAPCAARAAISIPNDCAAPPTADATANPIAPPMNVHLRPNRSPIRPPTNNSDPNDRA